MASGANPVSANEVDLSWTPVSTGAAGYEIYRSDNGGLSQLVATLADPQSDSYPDTSVAAGVTYGYSVVAYDDAGPSVAATATAIMAPAQPQNFQAIAASSTEIDLSWNAVPGATGYTVSRSYRRQHLDAGRTT